jgi:putative membrane protein
MADVVVRPTLKFIQAGYVLVAVILIAAIVVHVEYLQPRDQPPWLPIAAALLFTLPIRRHIIRQQVKMTVSGDKLRYEAGLLSKSTRIIQLAKVQDVRVNQSLAQRMFGVGDLAIETAGESSRLVVQHLDNPRRLAEELIEASSGHANAGHAPGV